MGRHPGEAGNALTGTCSERSENRLKVCGLEHDGPWHGGAPMPLAPVSWAGTPDQGRKMLRLPIVAADENNRKGGANGTNIRLDQGTDSELAVHAPVPAGSCQLPGQSSTTLGEPPSKVATLPPDVFCDCPPEHSSATSPEHTRRTIDGRLLCGADEPKNGSCPLWFMPSGTRHAAFPSLGSAGKHVRRLAG